MIYIVGYETTSYTMSVSNKVQLLEKNLLDIVLFLKEYFALIDVHLVDFINDNQWNYLSVDMQRELLGLGDDNLNMILHDSFLTPERIKQLPRLCSFIKRANNLTLKQLDICKSLSDILPVESTPLQTSTINDVSKWNTKLKKQHEVQNMAFAISALAKIHDINLVVDIGSGKGYLASYISLFHRLHVLGIEACGKRNERAIIRGAKLSNMYLKQCGKNDEKVRHSESINLSADSNRTMSTDLPHNANNDHSNKYIYITKYINATSDLQNIIIENISTVNSMTIQDTLLNFHCLSEENKERITTSTTCPNSNFERENLCSSTDSETCDSDSKRKQFQLNVVLCGLHTCGNLAVTLLRQFISCQLVSVLCSIGCCYNLLLEEFSNESIMKMDSPTEFGFPLSSVLRNRGFSLGRNARMLALQSKDRMSHKKLHQSLFYRAVLQVILREHYAVDKMTEIQVGRLAGKYHCFQDYVGKALAKLNFNQSNITMEKIDLYLHTYCTEEKKLQAFQMLRMVLAPCIETMILLDRLLYLCEQPCVKEAHLIQLFDPVISPRCYALIAVKNRASKSEKSSNAEP